MLKKSLWLIGAHLVAVAATVVFNTAVLCAGAAKYSNGCGGFQLYFMLWAVFTLPLLIAAKALEWRNPDERRWPLRVAAYMVVNIVVIELGWFVLRKFPLVLLLQVIVIAGAVWAERYFGRTRTG